MIIHISRERYEHIRSQGYSLTYYIAESGPVSLTGQHYSDGDNVYHMLDSDYGLCAECGAEFDSVIANNPAELDMAKYQLSRMEEFRNLAAQEKDFGAVLQ